MAVPAFDPDLHAPGHAAAHDALTLVWDRPEAVPPGASWTVECDGRVVARTTRCVTRVDGLEPERTYGLAVRSGGTVLSATATTRPQPVEVDPRSHGARGDGIHRDTAALQAAIDACPPGGVVRLAAGRWLSGALVLHDAMTLQLDAGAVLVGSEDAADYPPIPCRFQGIERPCHASLLTAGTPERPVRDLAIRGAGTVIGAGPALRAATDAAGLAGPARTLRIIGERVHLQGLTVRRSPFWCVHLVYCRDALLDHLAVHTARDEHGVDYRLRNGDGIDLDSCADVRVAGCLVSSQDDCIAVKSGRDEDGRRVGRACERIRIHDCDLRDGYGIALGSEIAGGLRDILIRDCTCTCTATLAMVKARRGRGGAVEDVLVEHVHHRGGHHRDCRWYRGAIDVQAFYGLETVDAATPAPVDAGTPAFRRIRFRDCSVAATGTAVHLVGLPERPLADIRLERVAATGPGGMVAANVDGLALVDCRIDGCDPARWRGVRRV